MDHPGPEYPHGCWSKRPSRISLSEFPHELARQFPGVFSVSYLNV
jgi:hypothetical protein